MSPRPPSPRTSTIDDVAAEAKLSRATVSRVLNGGHYVSEQARIAVEQAIARTGFTPSAAARRLKTRQSYAVAMVVHEPAATFLEDPTIGALLLGANDTLSSADYQLVSLVIDTPSDCERVIRYLSGGFVDGVVLISARTGDPVAHAVTRLGVPAAVIGKPSGFDALPFVGIDNIGAARMITQRLQQTGRRRIGMVVGALDRESGQDRLTGFRQALGEDFSMERVVDVPLYSPVDGLRGIRALLEREPDLDGVFASSDALAAGVMQGLAEAGRRVPDDVAVVGFDDSTWALRTSPALSTVRQPARRMGARAAALVLDQIRGRDVESDGVILETTVVWRESAGPAADLG